MEYVGTNGDWDIRSIIGSSKVAIETLSDGRIVYLVDARWEERFVHNADGEIWRERRRVGDEVRKPYRELWYNAPWKLRKGFFKRQVGLKNGPIYAYEWEERGWASGSFTTWQRRPVGQPDAVYEFTQCNES